MLAPPLNPVCIGMTPIVVAPGKNPVLCAASAPTGMPVRVGCSGASRPWLAATGATGPRGAEGL